MKVFKRLKRPPEIQMEQLVDWFRENIRGSWKIVVDVGVMPNNECDFIDDNFSLLLSRPEEYVLYKLTWE